MRIMQKVHLSIKDNIFEKVMYILNNLPREDVQIKIEDSKQVEGKCDKILNATSFSSKNFKFNRDEAHAR